MRPKDYKAMHSFHWYWFENLKVEISVNVTPAVDYDSSTFAWELEGVGIKEGDLSRVLAARCRISRNRVVNSLTDMRFQAYRAAALEASHG